MTVLIISVITAIEQKRKAGYAEIRTIKEKKVEEKIMLIRNNLFDDFFGDMFDDPFFSRGYVPQTQLMKTDIREKDGQYLLEIEVPGFSKGGYSSAAAFAVSSIRRSRSSMSRLLSCSGACTEG